LFSQKIKKETQSKPVPFLQLLPEAGPRQEDTGILS